MASDTIKAVWYESQKRWQVKVYKDGERPTFTCATPGRAGKRECERKALAWREGRASGSSDRASATFEAFLKSLKDTEGASSAHHAQYLSIYRTWINPRIGGRRLSQLTEGHLQAILDAAYRDGHLAERSIINIRRCISAWLRYCRKYKWSTLTSEFLTVPRGAKKGERTILQPDAVRTLFSSTETTFHRKVIFDAQIYRWRFEVATGLRPGEITGLQRSDISGGKIRLRRAINDAGETTSGKNDNARRSIKLSPTQKAILDAQLKYLAEAGVASVYVFPAADGKPLPQSLALRMWKRYVSHNGLPDVTLYELRHTWVSMIDDMPQGLKRRVIGHSENMDTEGVYGHHMDSDDERIIESTELSLQRVLKGLCES